MSEYINTSKEKLEILNQLIKAIREKKDIKDMLNYHQELFNNITPFDVFNILDFKADSMLSTNDIKEIAGKLMNIFRHGLEKYQWDKNIALIVEKLLDEGSQIKKQLNEIKPILKEISFENKELINSLFIKFKELEKRFLKMQNIIYPHIEKNIANPRPLSVLWSLQSDALNLLDQLLKEKDEKQLKILIGKFFFLVFGLIEKEELLVLPIGSRVIKNEEWEQIYQESLSYGFSFLRVTSSPKRVETPKEVNFDGLLFKSTTGGLSLEELLLVFDKIEVDITFVDENNLVKFFNNPVKRLFPRSPSIIGRNVNNCHPPESVHVVEEIINNFRANTKDEARFWINIKGRFIVISYFAIRNSKDEYKGVLEVSQDVTDIRALDGQKRLLDWDK